MKEQWTDKYKRSIDCDNPKGFSQRAHCQGKKKSFKEFKESIANYSIGPIDIYKPMSSMNTKTLNNTALGPGLGTYSPADSMVTKKENLTPFKKKVIQKLKQPVSDYLKKKQTNEDITKDDIKNFVDKTKIKATRWFKDVVDKIKRIATTSKRYEYAAKVLQDVIDRKEIERARMGLPLRHDIGYYAAVVADTFHDIDPKKLVKMVHESINQKGK